MGGGPARRRRRGAAGTYPLLQERVHFYSHLAPRRDLAPGTLRASALSVRIPRQYRWRDVLETREWRIRTNKLMRHELAPRSPDDGLGARPRWSAAVFPPVAEGEPWKWAVLWPEPRS